MAPLSMLCLNTGAVCYWADGLASSSARRRTGDADVPGRLLARDPFGRRSAAYRAASNRHLLTFTSLSALAARGSAFRAGAARAATRFELSSVMTLFPSQTRSSTLPDAKPAWLPTMSAQE